MKQEQEKELQVLESAYREKLYYINREEYERLKEIDDKIKKIEDEGEAEEDAAREKAEREKLTSLRSKILSAKDDEERKKAQKDYNDYVEELNRKARQRARKEQIDDLKEQRTQVKDEADAQKAVLKDQYDITKELVKQAYSAEIEAMKAQSTARLDEMKRAQKAEENSLKASNDAKLAQLKKSNDDALKGMKAGHDAQLKALKKSNQDQENALKESNDARLSEIKKGNQAQEDALKESHDAQLKELKASQNDYLDELKDKNDKELTAVKEKNQAEEDSLKESNDNKLKALKAQYDAEEKQLKETQENQLKTFKTNQDNQLAYLKKTNEAKLKAYKSSISDQLKQAKEYNQNLETSRQATDEDYEKAAQYSDKMMRQMSDNANKMGTDIGLLQNAYRGFTKDNYTMLDNLNLGFSGSKTGMQELLDYASTLDNAFDPTDMGLANVVDAIGLVQDAFGITGTTAAEALGTIEGSSRMTKAAWQNVVSAIAGGGDLEKAFGSLKKAIFGDGMKTSDGQETGLLGQLVPRFKKAFEGIAEFVGMAAPIFAAKIPKLIQELTPAIESLTQSFGVIFQTLAPIFEKAIGIIAPAMAKIAIRLGGEIVKAIVAGIGDMGPVGKAISGAIGIIFGSKVIGIISGFIKAIGGILPVFAKVVPAFESLKSIVFAATTILKVLFTIGPGKWALPIVAAITAIILIIKNWDTIVAVAKESWAKFSEGVARAGTAIKEGVKRGIDGAILSLRGFVRNVADFLAGLLKNAGAWAADMAKYLGGGVKSAVETAQAWFKSLPGNIATHLKTAYANASKWVADTLMILGTGAKKIAEEVGKWFKSIPGNIVNHLRTTYNNAKSWSESMLNVLGTGAKNVILGVGGWFKQLPVGIVNQLNVAFRNIKSWVNGTVTQMKLGAQAIVVEFVKKFQDLPKNLVTIGKNIVVGLWAGIGDRVQWFYKMIGSWASNLKDFLKRLFGINSPSKWARTVIGHALPEGMAVGVDEAMPGAERDISRSFDLVKKGLSGSVSGIFDDVLSGVSMPTVADYAKVSIAGPVAPKREELSGINDLIDYEFSRLINICAQYFPQSSHMQVALDTGVLVGSIAPAIDYELGNRADLKRRGV